MNDNHLNEYTAQAVENTYQTGSTKPPKSRKGIVALLLVTVIFLSGLVSALGLMNVRLSHQLEQLMEPELCTVAFTDSPAEARFLDSPLGFWADAVPPFWQEYDRLPQGLYITQVDAARQAAFLGIQAGDILLALDGSAVSDWDGLIGMLGGKEAGCPVLLTLYRNGSCQDILLTLYE